MKNEKETMMPPEFDLEFALEMSKADHEIDAEEWLLPDDLPVPDPLETIFDGEITFDQPEPNWTPPTKVGKKENGLVVGAGALQKRLPTTNRAETALVPARPQKRAERPTFSPPPEVSTVREKHVVFTLAGAGYAVPMSHILEVCELEHFTSVPNVPEWVMGVTSLRGDIVSIVDMRALLSLEPGDYVDVRSLLVTQTLECDITACLAVERVTGLANISASEIQTIDTIFRDRLTPYARGVYANGNELVTVLNLESLLRSLEIIN